MLASVSIDRETLPGNPGHQCDFGGDALEDRRVATPIAHYWASSMAKRGHAVTDVRVRGRGSKAGQRSRFIAAGYHQYSGPDL